MSDKLIFDKILNHAKVNQHIIANTYLHIHNAHPELLKKYNLTSYQKYFLSIKFKLVFLTKVFQSIFDNKHFYSFKKVSQSPVLFISHLTNNLQIYEENDSYFGNLPNELLAQNIESSIVLLNHTGVRLKKPLSGWENSKISRFILSTSLSFWSEIKLYYSQKKSKTQLEFILEHLDVDNATKKDILQRQLSFGTINSLRIAQQVSSIIQETGAKYIITTYEGHAWECLVYYYARRANLNIKCFGYQHAAVSEHQYAIKRPLSKEYNPDVILTSGLVSQTIFSQIQEIKSDIVCVGSPKYSISSAISNKTQCCLVATQGEVIECLTLFEFSLAYAQQHQKQRFIWRLHPIINFEQLKKHSDIFKNLPDNIYLSKDNLEEDIQKCDSILYRGTTVVVNAINAGLKPIYYQQSIDELSIDPIYTQQMGKFIVSNQSELNSALEKRIDIKAKQDLQSFAQDFYTSLNVSILLKEVI